MKESKSYDAVVEVKKHRKMFGIIHWNSGYNTFTDSISVDCSESVREVLRFRSGLDRG